MRVRIFSLTRLTALSLLTHTNLWVPVIKLATFIGELLSLSFYTSINYTSVNFTLFPLKYLILSPSPPLDNYLKLL